MNAQKSVKQQAVERQICILLERSKPTHNPSNPGRLKYQYTAFVAVSNGIRPVFFPKAEEIARSLDVPEYLRNALGAQEWLQIFSDRYAVCGRKAEQRNPVGHFVLDGELRKKIELAILRDLIQNLKVDQGKITFLDKKTMKDFGNPLAEGHLF